MTGLPAGVRLRAVDVEADLEAAYAVVRDCELADAGWSDATLEGTRSLLSGPDAMAEAALIAERDGRAVGLLAVEVSRSEREVFLDAFVVGEDAEALQGALLEAGLATARALAAEDPGPGPARGADPLVPSPDLWQVLAAAYEQDERYARVLSDAGMVPIRRFWRMLLDVTGRSGVDPVAPRSVVKRVVASAEDRRMMHKVFKDSFAEHFGARPDEPFEHWIETVGAMPGTDPDRWFLAYLEGEAVGILILDDSKSEFGHGYVRTLGVRAEARGRGIATWLLEVAVADAVRRGHTGLALSVDGANATGATDLYEKVGFRKEQVIDLHCLPLG